MQGVLEGVRVLEVATWTFVPAAGAVLADWGADVIKVEHPKTGDLFTIIDPALQLNQLEQVQRDVADLLEHGLNPPAPEAPVVSPEPAVVEIAGT